MVALRVESLDDPGAIERILTHAAIDPKLAHDGRAPGHINHPLLAYFGGYVETDLAAVFTAIRFSRWETEVHGAVLPEAIQHGRVLGRLFLDHVFARSEVARATAYVLGTLPSASNWCRKMGFVDEGRRRSACMVDGVPTDVLVLGMLREEWLISCRTQSHLGHPSTPKDQSRQRVRSP
jgi:hypothetical protein